jgi:hypothetical protein
MQTEQFRPRINTKIRVVSNPERKQFFPRRGSRVTVHESMKIVMIPE